MSDRFRRLEFEPTEVAPSAPEVERDQHFYLAEATRFYLEGDFEPALRSYSTALKFDKALHEAWAGQVRCLTKMGEFREAKTWAEKACSLFPGVPVLDSARALALSAAGLSQEALNSSDLALEQAEKTSLSDPHLWLERGVCLLAARRTQTAEHCFGKALELAPNDPDWSQRVAAEWLEGSEPARALELLNQVVAQRPQRAYVWLLQARAFRRLGQRAQAEQTLARAEALRVNWSATTDERRLLRRNCWIATLVFGHEEHPAVRSLRRWRDLCWLTHPLGRALSRLYDGTAPGICRLLAGRPRLQGGLRRGLGYLARQIALEGARTGWGDTGRKEESDGQEA